MPDLTLEWAGRPYRVPEDQMFELMEAIERHITLPELLAMVGAGRPNFSALARPLHEMLKFAGVRDLPTPLELRRMLVSEGMDNLVAQRDGRDAVSQRAMQAVAAMIEILMDGADLGDQDAEPAKKTRPRSSKAATKSRSGNGVSRRKTSGA
jgi:hypothetical protein